MTYVKIQTDVRQVGAGRKSNVSNRYGPPAVSRKRVALSGSGPSSLACSGTTSAGTALVRTLAADRNVMTEGGEGVNLEMLYHWRPGVQRLRGAIDRT